METSAKKTRVSNETILTAIVQGNAALAAAFNNLALVLAKPGHSVRATDEPKAPIRMAHTAPVREVVAAPVAKATSTERLIGHLPEATEIPKGIKVEWLAGLEAKARRWANEKGETDVFVYFVRNSFGQHKPLFGRGSSKCSANAVSIYRKVA